eukprot:TRINITY_DN1016_c0_g1_i1.p1 TRINITY_DN1016_c0_g1~~TRINITY_DN1016_c0_g1_i1.p1  ORF type:complete len:1336 (+),score=244.49 TRINITY_DN1016_c0_g1_i1:78-4010(+)
MEQINLVPSGSQPWSRFMCSLTSEHFIYCSSLATYVFRLPQFTLQHLLTGHQKTITGLAACRTNPHVIATSSVDRTIRVWDIDKGVEIGNMSTEQHDPRCLEWTHHSSYHFASASARGVFRLWNYPAREFAPYVLNTDSISVAIRWNPHTPDVVLVALDDGSLSLIDTNKKKINRIRKIPAKEREALGPIHDIQWDILSPNYVLIGHENGAVFLYDVELEHCVQEFDRISAGIECLQWIPGEPGNFISMDSRSGVVRSWNVSLKASQSVSKVSSAGFIDAVFAKTRHSDPENKKLLLGCTFRDGSTGVYCWHQKKFIFQTEPNHTETIFSCSWNPLNVDEVATASYDRRVKVWNVSTLKCLMTTDPAPGIVYSASWSLDAERIAGSTSTGDVILWNSRKGFILDTIHLFNSPSFVVSYHPTIAGSLIASAKSGAVKVFQENGTVVRSFDFKAGVFGVAWHPTEKDKFAAGCFDSCVYVISLGDVASGSSGCLSRLIDANSSSSTTGVECLRGHSDRVYNVSWNPYNPKYLASSSNDKNVIVWDLTSEKHISLIGHSANTRALSWCSAIPYILLSGSWDATIRCWDIRDGRELAIGSNHYADVYGLASHPERPFLFLSTSRDTSLRVWNLRFLSIPSILNSILGRHDEVVMSEELDPFAGSSNPRKHRLCSKEAIAFMEKIKSIPMSEILARLEVVLNFFPHPPGSSSFLSTLKSHMEVKRGSGASSMSTVEEGKANVLSTKAQMHADLIVDHFLAKTKRWPLPSSSTRQMSAQTKDDKLKTVGARLFELGRIRDYCQYCVELGEWEKAIAVAPLVSLKYWKKLCHRYADSLSKRQDEMATVYHIASGDAESAVEFHLDRHDYDEAMLVAVSAEKGKYRVVDGAPSSLERTESKATLEDGSRKNPLSVMNDLDSAFLSSKQKVAHSHALYWAARSHAIMAAAQLLSVDELDASIKVLLMGNEVVLAYCVAQLFKPAQYLIDETVSRLSKFCESWGLFSCSRSLLEMLSHSQFHLKLFCSRYEGSDDQIRGCYSLCGVQPPAYHNEAEKRLEHTKDRILSLMLGRSYQPAFSLLYQKVKFVCSQESGWQYHVIEDLIPLLHSLDVSALDMSDQMRCFALCHFFGGLQALWRKWYHVAAFEFKRASKLVKKHNFDDFAISHPIILAFQVRALSHFDRLTASTLLARFDHFRLSSHASLAIDLKRSLQKTLEKKGHMKSHPMFSDKIGMMAPYGSTLPHRARGGVFSKSSISGTTIHGKAVQLGPKTSASVSEAIMLSLCNPFSHAHDGSRLNPETIQFVREIDSKPVPKPCWR